VLRLDDGDLRDDGRDVNDRREDLRALSGGHPKDIRHIWYSLGGPDLDPMEVTTLTGMTPDRAWHRGDPKARTGIPQSDGHWSIDSGLAPHDEFHDHVDALLARLRPAWAAFVDLGRRYDANIDAAIYLLEAQGPLIEVLPDVAAALHELNATIGFDLYALPEDEPTK
jgi:hypothetical protein